MKVHRKSLVLGLVMSFGAAVAPETTSVEKGSGPAPVTALTMMSTSMPTSNIERSLSFYVNGLGMKVMGRMEMGAVTEVPLSFPGGGPNLMLLYPKAGGAPLPVRGSLSRIILMVPDMKALELQLKSAGFSLKGKINEMAQYKVAVAQVEDPDGNHIELVQRFQ